jgi:hypothetical protein
LDVVVERRRRVVVARSQVGPFGAAQLAAKMTATEIAGQPSASLYRARLLNCRELSGLM